MRELQRGTATLLLLAIGAAWGLLAFHGIAADAGPLHGDWDHHLTLFEIQRRALTTYGQLPLWDPWLLGGIPGLAHPEFDVLSPFFAPILLFGSVRGAAIFAALHALVGLIGMYRLARALGRSRAVALLAAVVFLFVFSPIVLYGVVNRMNGSLLPWLFLGYLQARRSARGIALVAAATALLLLEGGIYATFGGVLLVLIAALFDGSPREVLLGLVRFGAGAIGAALTGARLLPLLELYAQFPRQSGFYATSALVDLHRFAELPAAIAALLGAHQIGARRLLFDQPIFAGVDLGLPLLALLLIALVTGWRRPLLWLLFGVPLLLVLGNASPLNLWAALTRLPGVESLNLPMSLLFVPFLALALLLADAARRLSEGLFAGPAARAAFAVLALVAGLPLAFQLFHLFDGIPRNPVPPAASAQVPFVQTRGARDEMLPSIRRNEGVVDAYEAVVHARLPIAALPREAPNYVGEWRLERAKRPLAPLLWSPSRLEFAWDGAAADRLLVNQNGLPGWRATLAGHSCPVTRVEGRLAVELPAEAGTLVLRYAPTSLAVGCGVSALGVAGFALLFSAGARRRLDRERAGRLDARLGPG